MKQIFKPLLIAFILLLTIPAYSQDDVIFYKNGVIDGRTKIIEINETQIKYNKTGRTRTFREIYTIPKSEVFMIKYKNGSKLVMESPKELSAKQENIDHNKNDASQPPKNSNANLDKKKNEPVYNEAVHQPSGNADRIFLHNGKIIEGKITRVKELSIEFIYTGETAEQVIGKYAVRQVIYSGSNRVENMTQKIRIASIEDWENVVIVYDIAEIAGLTKVGDLLGSKNALSNSRADMKATRKLKQAAAESGCQFVLITNQNASTTISGTADFTMSSSNATYKGVGYKY